MSSGSGKQNEGPNSQTAAVQERMTQQNTDVSRSDPATVAEATTEEQRSPEHRTRSAEPVEPAEWVQEPEVQSSGVCLLIA